MSDDIRTRPATDEYREGFDAVDWGGKAKRKRQIEDFLDGTGPEDFPGTDEDSHYCSKAALPDPLETEVILCSVCRFFKLEGEYGGWCGYHGRQTWKDSDCDQGELWTDPSESDVFYTGPCPICHCKILQCKACNHTIDLRTHSTNPNPQPTKCKTPPQKQD